jgi:hypothetical protein
MKTMTMLSTIATCFVISACSDGLDKSPNLSSPQAYRETIDQDLAKVKPEEAEAFNFAVSDLNFDQLKQKYPNTSYRKIAKSELESYLSSLQAKFTEAQQLEPEYEKRRAELAKISVEVLDNKLTHDTFFKKRDLKYNFRLTNGSSISMSKVQLVANFSINGKPDVLYQWNPVVNFENGLRPGQSATFTGSMVGFLSFDQPITLEVREASSREVTLEVTDLADFSEQWLIGKNSLMDQSKTLPSSIEETKKHLANL